jgi:type IV pilus assembly protein PilY1
MWEFTDSLLGFTCCTPAVLKIKNSSGPDKWYLVFGSGPTGKWGEATRPAWIYVVDPYDGTLVHKIQVPGITTAVTNIFTCDYGLRYSVNLIYFGTYNALEKGKIYRLMTHDNIDPAAWTLSDVIDLDRPVTAEGTVATDDRGNLWIYFGSGKYFNDVDARDTEVQVMVGIKDDTTSTTPITFSDLVDVTNVAVSGDSVGGLTGVSDFDGLVDHIEAHDGWVRYFDSLPGERILFTPMVIGGALVFSSFIPTIDSTGLFIGKTEDLCMGGSGGPQAGNLWGLFYKTGTAYKVAMLGTNAAGEHRTYSAILGDMPSDPSMYIGPNQESALLQSAGGLVGIETPLPYNPRGGVMLWRGK